MAQNAALGQFADLLASIPPGTVTAVVRTPFGNLVQDPFSQESSSIAAWLRPFVSLEVYAGPPHVEDLEGSSLTENLKVFGLVVGGLGLLYFGRKYWR